MKTAPPLRVPEYDVFVPYFLMASHSLLRCVSLNTDVLFKCTFLGYMSIHSSPITMVYKGKKKTSSRSKCTTVLPKVEIPFPENVVPCEAPVASLTEVEMASLQPWPISLPADIFPTPTYSSNPAVDISSASSGDPVTGPLDCTLPPPPFGDSYGPPLHRNLAAEMEMKSTPCDAFSPWCDGYLYPFVPPLPLPIYSPPTLHSCPVSPLVKTPTSFYPSYPFRSPSEGNFTSALVEDAFYSEQNVLHSSLFPAMTSHLARSSNATTSSIMPSKGSSLIPSHSRIFYESASNFPSLETCYSHASESPFSECFKEVDGHSLERNEEIFSSNSQSGGELYYSNAGDELSEENEGDFDFTESDEEGQEDYREGGYHPVRVGEIYRKRYRIEGKLGWGHFSTVWLATDLLTTPLSYVAIKFQKSAENYYLAAVDEISLLKCARNNWKSRSHLDSLSFYKKVLGSSFTERLGVVGLSDHFIHQGPNGRHICLIFEVMGPNILTLMKQYNFQGIPLDIVRKVASNVLVGLDFLHRSCRIIHTDVKPENIVVNCELLPLPRPPPHSFLGAQKTCWDEIQWESLNPELRKKLKKKKKRFLQKERKRQGMLGGDPPVEASPLLPPPPPPSSSFINSSHTLLSNPLKNFVSSFPHPTCSPPITVTASTSDIPKDSFINQEEECETLYFMPPSPASLQSHALSSPSSSIEKSCIDDCDNKTSDMAILSSLKQWEAPPYVKHLLKPTKSDPNLKPYHYGLSYLYSMNESFKTQEYSNSRLADTSVPRESPYACKDGFYPSSKPQFSLSNLTQREVYPLKNGDEAITKSKSVYIETNSGLFRIKPSPIDIFFKESAFFKICDLGNACWIDRHFSESIQTRQYRSPEVIIRSGYDTSADMWSFACMIFELVTGEYLFDPKKSKDYDRDEDHLALIMEFFGNFPSSMIRKGLASKKFFLAESKQLKHIPEIRSYELEETLMQRGCLSPTTAAGLAAFLLPMLKIDPEKRATAEEMLHHPWLYKEESSTEKISLKGKSNYYSTTTSSMDGYPPPLLSSTPLPPSLPTVTPLYPRILSDGNFKDEMKSPLQETSLKTNLTTSTLLSSSSSHYENPSCSAK
ncbi:putative cell-cycle-associated protein kinase SRPK, partial [Cardiosporidium cionae]